MKIIGISGRKQSGKNTVANYINGSVLLSRSMIRSFYIDDDGKLIVETTDANGEVGFGEFDVTRKDKTFTDYANQELWPYIKVYHFADPLKEMAVNIFGINPQNVYGSDEDKNKLTHILWENLPNNGGKTGNISSREFLQHFGTNIIRKIHNNAWVNATINRISFEESEISIIPDVRFPNEVEAIKNSGGVVIRLTRDVHHSEHESEMALDKDKFDWANFDYIIDNSSLNLEELCGYLKQNSNIWTS